MMSSTLSKIHVTNSTGLSLNERFTAISTQPKVVTNIVGTAHRSGSRSRSTQRRPQQTATVEHVSSRANQRLLAQLQRKHKVQAALKLKRRSMRTVGGGSNGNGGGANVRIQRGSVKAFRVGANGKPIRTNSLARVATMKADNELSNNRRPLRRSNSSGSLANRLGPRRPTVGGAAQRVARRNIDRQRRRNDGRRLFVRGRTDSRSNGINNRSRSRSRSRTRIQPDNRNNRSRSRSRTRNPDNQNNGIRSRSRNRNRNDVANAPAANNSRRGRSRSRSRGRAAGIVNKAALPIKARLGVRPVANREQNKRFRSASLTRRGVQTGRVQKRRNSTNSNVPRAAISDINGRGRIRSRSAVRNVRNGGGNVRSRSGTRRGQVGQQKQQGTGQVRPQQRNNRAPRGRANQQRRANNNNKNNNNNSNSRQRGGSNNNGKIQTQQRRGRSRSRTGRGGNVGGSRNQGNKTTTTTTTTTKSAVNKDDLDKELDQYMATTKTENEMDYLLKN